MTTTKYDQIRTFETLSMSKRKAEPPVKAVEPATDSDAEEDAALANLAIEDGDSDEGEVVEGGWSDDEPVDEDRAEETDEGEDNDDDDDEEKEEEDDEGSPADDEVDSDEEDELEDGSEDDEGPSESEQEQQVISNRSPPTDSRRKVLTKKASKVPTWDSDEDEDRWV